MTVDFGPVLQALAPLALASMTAAVPYGVLLLQRLLKVRLTESQVAVITQACDKGAEAAYGFMAGQGATLAHTSIKNAAVAQGVNHVLASVPDALKKLGISPDQVERMVEARLGGLVARHHSIVPQQTENAASLPAPTAAPVQGAGSSPAPAPAPAPAPVKAS
jgi:hypothetical protein